MTSAFQLYRGNLLFSERPTDGLFKNYIPGKVNTTLVRHHTNHINEIDLDIPRLDLPAKIQVCTSVRSAVRVRHTDRHTDR